MSNQRSPAAKQVAAVLVVTLVVILGVGYALQATHDPAQPASAPRGAVDTFAVPAGKASAPVTVTVYEDLLCPYCGRFERLSRSMLQKYVGRGDVRLKYHVVAFLDRSSTSRYSSRAANALAAVLDASGPMVAKRFHDLLFDHQPSEGSAGLTNEQLVRFAVRAGAPGRKVARAVEAGTFKQWVENGTDQASRAGVNQTPTVFVGHHRLPLQDSAKLVDALQQAIEDKVG
jgi:protein-disulfide isomerase